jgi:hypothetical protein
MIKPERAPQGLLHFNKFCIKARMRRFIVAPVAAAGYLDCQAATEKPQHFFRDGDAAALRETLFYRH